MSEKLAEEIFRYVRVRGLTADGLANANIITPPVSSQYRLLSQKPGSPANLVGLQYDASHTITLPDRSAKLVELFKLGTMLADGKIASDDIAAQLAATTQPTDEDICWLWDSLGLSVLDPARQHGALTIMQTLRAAQFTADWSDEKGGDVFIDALQRARAANIHLPTFSSALRAIQPPPPTLGTSTAAEQPSSATLKVRLDQAERLVDEITSAPMKRVEMTAQATEPTQPSLPRPRGIFSWFARQPESVPSPTTKIVLEQDLTVLSVQSVKLADEFGGIKIGSETLLRTARKESLALARTLAAQAGPKQKLVVSGGNIYKVATGAHHAAVDSAVVAHMDVGELQAFDVSASKCSVKVQAVAEFVRVEQTLDRYVAGEIAHIENILQGEMKERLTRSLTRSEAVLVEDSERQETTERETQTTSRFEMENEAENSLQAVAETHGGIGASFSGTTGSGTIVVEGSLGFSSQTSKDESEKSATKFSQNVTSRALDNIKTTVAQHRTSKLLKEFEDTARHVLDNRGGEGHVVGSYRWIDKIYKARAMNYGGRVAIEILVENPGRFLRPMKGGHDIHLPMALDDPSHPFGPLHSSADISRTNYAYYGSLYGADVKPPPQKTFFVTKHEARGPDIYGHVSEVGGQVEIPDGYVTKSFTARGDFQNPGRQVQVIIFIGTETGSFTQSTVASGSLPGYSGKLSYGFALWSNMYSIAIAVECELTDLGFQAWQLETYRKLREAYETAVHDAENEAAQEQARQGVAIQGRNPVLNEQIVQKELKKVAIWALGVGTSFWLSEGVNVVCDNNGTTLPRLDRQTCSTLKMATLLESAIDWKLMSFQLLPYYWANACDWQDLLDLSDADPLYTEFLQAGAARIVVPVAQGEAAGLELLYFLATGNRWDSPATPPILGGMEELAAIVESQTLEGAWPVQIGGSWEVKIPTTLTVLECGSACVDGSLVDAQLEPPGKFGILKGGASHGE